MIGILVPAHDEAASVERCLQSIRRAALHPELHGEAVQVVVALDSCSDATASICQQQRTLAFFIPSAAIAEGILLLMQFIEVRLRAHARNTS